MSRSPFLPEPHLLLPMSFLGTTWGGAPRDMELTLGTTRLLLGTLPSQVDKP